ncbi:MAG: TolC family protein [Chloracidobacterium sp.]|nr:TolC family protein [Chloracidobacterium sp.]
MTHKVRCFSKILLLGSLLAASAAAQTPAPTATPDDDVVIQQVKPALQRPMPDVSRAGVEASDELPLTLQQAIEMALQNNNDIDSSRNDVAISEFNLRGSRGIYDPLVSSQNYYESRTTPTASTIGGAVNGAVGQRQFLSDLGVSGFSPKFGGSYSAVLTSSRANTTNRNATLNPQYPTSLVVTYTQPLFRNRRIDNNRRQIAIAKKNVELSDAALKLKAIDVVTSVEQAYWQLTFALKNLQIQIDTLKQAREQLESNRRLVEKGALAPIEIVAATAQIANFEQLVYTAQETVTRSENALKTLLLPDNTAAEWSRALIPVSQVSLSVPHVGFDVARTEAFQNRVELEQLADNEEINSINLKYYKNQTKPQIDLFSTYTSSGLAGTPRANASGTSSVPDNLHGGYFKSFGNLLQQEYPTYRVGIQIGFPIGNHTAKANLGRTLVEGDKLKNIRAQTEQAIEADVRNAIQALRSAESRLASAVAARQAAEELYDSEQRQFRAGITTFYLVTQRQTDLLAARGRELQAQTDLNIAISVFRRSIGETLSHNNITVLK